MNIDPRACWLLLLFLIPLAPFWMGFLGQWIKLFRTACCKMGWHSPSRLWESTGHDGCSAHARCPWCGFEGMIDSQGNLF